MRVALAGLGVAVGALAVKAVLALSALNPVTAAIGLGLVGLAFIVEDLWSAFNGGDSVFKSVQQKVRAFFEPMEVWLMDLPRKLLAMLAELSQKVPGLIANMLPDFLKDGLSASIKSASQIYHHMAPIPLNSSMAPTQSNISNHHRFANNVNVAGNVKSGADPQTIGGEVSKKLSKN